VDTEDRLNSHTAAVQSASVRRQTSSITSTAAAAAADATSALACKVKSTDWTERRRSEQFTR